MAKASSKGGGKAPSKNQTPTKGAGPAKGASGTSSTVNEEKPKQARAAASFLDIYNPQNAENLTDAQADAMASLTPEQIGQLAEKYPNGPSGQSYIRLRDTTLPPEKQLYPLSTWENLQALYKIGTTKFVPHSFNVNFKKPGKPAEAPVQDLTKDEALNELRDVTRANPQNASFAKDQNDKLVTEEGQGNTGATDPDTRQGGDVSGNGRTNTASIQEHQERIQGGGGDVEDEDEVPLSELGKEGLQEKYKDVTGEAAPSSWSKAKLIEEIEAAQEQKQ